MLLRWASWFAADKVFEKIAVEKIGDFETALLSYMNSEHDLMDAINVSGDYNDDIEATTKL